MKLPVIIVIGLVATLESKASLPPEDSSTVPKFYLRITDYVTQKCSLADSVSKRFKSFLIENVTVYRNCRKDSSQNIRACKPLITKMEMDIKEKFGKDVYDAYYKIAHPPSCRPPRKPKDISLRPRRSASTYQR